MLSDGTLSDRRLSRTNSVDYGKIDLSHVKAKIDTGNWNRHSFLKELLGILW